MPPAPLRVACVGHALKESLTPKQCLEALTQGVRRAGHEVCASLCMSDGGDGFLEAMEACVGRGEFKEVRVRSPHGKRISSRYLLVRERSMAVIESAEAVGLRLVPPGERQILRLGTGGLAELLLDALGEGMRQIVVGLGGSATCDGGVGMLALLNDVLLEALAPHEARWLTATALAQQPQVAVAALREVLRRRGVTIRAAADVESPLLGPTGAAYRFAPQKGASPDEVAWLEQQLAAFAESVECALGESYRYRAGAGAAGGLGFAFLALGATVEKGADVFLRLPEFERAFRAADVIVTAEGRFDETSFGGKAPWRVAQEGRGLGKGVAIFCAHADSRAAERAKLAGVTVIPFAVDVPQQEARRHAHELLSHAVASYFSSKH